MAERTVVIAGGGASGTLVATHLLRRSDEARVVVIEPRERIGPGVAYSTQCPDHVLNVPAKAMSAFAGKPGDFVDWLRAGGYGDYDANAFVPRGIYGAYLSATARTAFAAAGERFRHVRSEAIAVDATARGVDVRTSDGSTIAADAFVLATGNAAPSAWPRISESARASGRYFGSAWAHGALEVEDPGEVVLLLGSGLTAVDAVLELRHNGHRGPIYMVSRRGLLPHEHRLFDAPPEADPEAESMRDLVETLRGGANWRVALDGMRPKTNALWQALTLAEQRRFVRHVMPYWNVHRHRMAPQVAKTLAELIAADRLRSLAGKTGPVDATANGLQVAIDLRGGEGAFVLEAGRVINCSGPQHDFRKLPQPLIRQMLASGAMTPYVLDIGIVVDANGALVDADERPSDRCFAIGPIRYGTLIETTAIPEIRAQAEELADLILTADRSRR